MKKITLKQLELQNFKGARHRQVSFEQVTSIYGANGTGKTTLLDAFTWLLFDKDSTGTTKFNIRPLDEDGNPINNVEIMVQAVLSVDGQETTLQKTQKQNWVKRRGSDTATLQGNSNSFEVNGFPASDTEFKAKVAAIIPDNLFKLLTDPRAFASLPWKDQRAILLEMVSDVTDEDVLATNPDGYAPIAEELKQAPVEKIIEKAKKTMVKLKDRQKELPARIDEASKALVEVPEASELELHRSALNEQLQDIWEQQKDMGAAYQAVADIQASIMQAKLDLSTMEREASASLDEKRREARRTHDELRQKGYDLFTQRKAKEAELANQAAFLEDANKQLGELGEKWKEATALRMDDSEMVCQMCGQVLPQDKIAEIRNKFSDRKNKTIERINEQGRKCRENVNAIKDKMAAIEAEIADLKRQWDENSGLTGKAFEALNAIPASVDVTWEPGYIAKQDELTNLQNQLAGMDTGEKLREQLSAKEKSIRSALEDVNHQFVLVEANDRTNERIAELQAEQREVAQDVADQERKIYLLEEFSKAKMDMLSSSINGKFKLVNFKLFERQINGGIKPTCEMTMSGVPYSGLNSAGKIQAGLDVIEALSELYDVSAPIWLDNRESVVEIPPMDTQLINLYVSAADKELEVR